LPIYFLISLQTACLLDLTPLTIKVDKFVFTQSWRFSMAIESAEEAVDRMVHEVGQRAKSLRLQHDLGQEELSKRVGIDQRGVSKLERGAYKRVEFLISLLKYARYFKTDPALLLFGTGHQDVSVLTQDAVRIAQVWDKASSDTKLAVANLLLNAVHHF
jgi:transcriptional regulator with XRE-family HTH domain